MIERQVQLIETLDISDNLKISTSISFDESRLFLDVDFKKGKYKIQRSFKNNYMGLEDMTSTKKQFNSEEKLNEYFNL